MQYDSLEKNKLIVLDVPSKNIHQIKTHELKENWQNDIPYSRFIGNEFLKQQSALLMEVPSAIIPQES
ncbi:hypothetical protein ABTL69_19780, partial [Acinetobacter baumannii]